jgi:hypothetical protein
LRYRRTRWVGTFDDLIRGFGGWAISDHHIYDPVTRVLAMGNGELRTDVTTGWVTQSEPGFTSRWGIVSTAAPDGTLYVATGPSSSTAADRILRFSPAGALDSVQISIFGDVTGLAAGADGELYVGRSGPGGDNDGCIVRMRSWTNSASAFEAVIGNCGTASTSVPLARVPLVCEACGTPASGPNQVASARVQEPRNMAVSPEGVLAYTEIQSAGIGYRAINFYREVSGTRLLTLFRTSSSDQFGPITFDRAGRMYWSIQPNGAVDDPWLVRRLDDDADPGSGGVISDGSIVLGGGSNLVDGVRATGSTGLRLMYLRALGVLPTGELVAVQDTRVRLVGVDDRVRTIAGCSVSGDCVDPSTTTTQPGRRTTVAAARQGATVLPSGTIVYSSGADHPVVRLTQALPPFGTVNHRIPSRDASLVYEFDADGRHLYTRDAITDTVLLSFAYDATGRLSSLTDAELVATNVTYPTGTQIALTSPGPNVTTIFVASSDPKYASTITSGGRSWLGSLGTNGLLTSFLEPGEPAAHTFSYTADGRLDTDNDVTDAGGAGGALVDLDTPAEGFVRLFRQRNTTPAVSVQSEYRWGTVTDPASTDAPCGQRDKPEPRKNP